MRSSGLGGPAGAGVAGAAVGGAGEEVAGGGFVAAVVAVAGAEDVV